MYDSEALRADGINNVTDIIASLAVLIGLRMSQKPPDSDHPYGHYRAETVASLIASLIIAAAGIQVMFQSMQSIFYGKDASPDLLSAWVALFCAIAMYAVYLYNRNLANRVKSIALKAAAADNRSDAFVSLGAAAGIFGSHIGLPWMDSFAAFLVGGIIMKTAWHIFRETTHALTDGFDQSKLTGIEEAVRNTEGVIEVGEIKARVSGNKIIVDLVVFVDGALSLMEGHAICDEIERRLTKKPNILSVHVHLEPYAGKPAASARSVR